MKVVDNSIHIDHKIQRIKNVKTLIIDLNLSNNRINEIGIELSKKFTNEVPIFIGILNGSFIFLADLLRVMTINCEMDFLKLRSYSEETSSGTVRLLKDISADITDRHVVVIEDIVDSGLTLRFLKKRLVFRRKTGPKWFPNRCQNRSKMKPKSIKHRYQNR